ncbi:MAG TPA: glycosyltransferase family 2 protein, partial [Thermopolyspora sp.]
MHPSSHSVTAIVVAHDGARWLRETLDAVLRQSRPVDRVVGVDNGSRDGGAQILGEAFGPGNVLTLPRSTGFGQAVADALGRLSNAFDPPDAGREWIWLIHDDCAPDQHALAALLWAAERDEKAVILGPKLRDWLDRRVLLEAGVTVDRSGRRDTGLEPREYDQGQHDRTHDVLSVSTAGMLTRRDVWERLGGLDPGLPLFRDDLDLCWRAHAAGHRVLIVTEAVAYHAEAAARRRRRITVTDSHPHRLDRRNAMFVIMVNLPFGALLWSLVRNTLASILRTLVLLLAKQPANAFDEISSLCWILGHPGRVFRARRVRRRDRRRGYPAVKRLLTPAGMAYRRFADMIQGYLSGAGPIDSAGRHHVMLAEPSGDDGDELLTDAGLTQRFFGNPGVLLTLALTAVALVAGRSVLMGDGLLGGGALVPVAGSGADLWHFYTATDHLATGLGSDGWAAPYVAILAGLSALCFGKTWLAVSVLLLGCVPLAGLSAYLATRSMISYAPARVWLAASYALLPVAMGTVSAGRIGTAVVLVLLPAYAVLIGR